MSVHSRDADNSIHATNKSRREVYFKPLTSSCSYWQLVRFPKFL